MTLAEACTRVAELSQLDLDLFVGERKLDDSGAIATDAQLRKLVNWGVRLIANYIEPFAVDIPFTLVAGNAKYNLKSTAGGTVPVIVKEPYRIYVPNRGYLVDPDGYPGIVAPSKMHRLSFGWHDTAPGDPRMAIWLGPATGNMYLYPGPSVSFASTYPTLLLECTYLPLPFDVTVDVNDNTELPLPYELHDAACFAAAVNGRLPMVTEQSAWASIKAYNDAWISEAMGIRKAQDNARAGDLNAGISTMQERWLG